MEKQKNSSIERITGEVENTTQTSISKVKAAAAMPCSALLEELESYAESHDINIEAMLREELGLKDKARPNTAQRVGKLIKLLTDFSQDCKHPISMLHERPCYYNGKYWETLSDVALGQFFARAGEILKIAEYEAQFDSFIMHARNSFAYAVHAVVKPKKGTSLLNCSNGTLELSKEGVTLRGHKPEDGLMYALPYEYNPDANAPLFRKLLNDALPEDPDQANLQEFVGSLFSDVNHEKVAYLYGPSGRNGKTTLQTVIIAALGDTNVSSESLSHLTDVGGTGECARAALEGKLLNACGDIDSKISSAGVFKLLASREKLTVRPPYERASRDIPAGGYARLMFSCNNLPVFMQGAAKAEAARFLFIEFNNEVQQKDMIRDLAQRIIREELPGVLNWIIEGLQRIEENGGEFTKNENSERVRDRFLEGSNSVASWLDEIGLKAYNSENKFKYPDGTGAAWHLKGFYKGTDEFGFIASTGDDIKNLIDRKGREELSKKFCYVNYCKEAGRKEYSRTNFKEALEQLGFPVEHKELMNTAVFVWIPSDEELEKERKKHNRKRNDTVFED